jgi:hypothetical protein
MRTYCLDCQRQKNIEWRGRKAGLKAEKKPPAPEPESLVRMRRWAIIRAAHLRAQARRAAQARRVAHG